MQKVKTQEDGDRAAISTVGATLTLVRTGVFDPPDRLASPPPWIGHIPFAFWIVDVLRPSTLVELGTHSGNSYSAFCQAIQRARISSSAFAVDTWKGDDHAGFYDEDVFAEFSQYHDSHYASFSRLVRSTFDDAVNYFSDSSIDLLHIDGLHTYDAVKHDFETWFPKMSARGVILVHDTNVRENEFAVWKYWSELAATYPHFRFDHCHGLGVIGVGSAIPAELKRLFSLSRQDPATDAALVRQFFSTLGAAHLQTHAGRAFQTKPQRSEVSRELDKLWQELGPQFGLVVSKVDTIRTEQSRIGLELTERFEASVRDLGQRAANINSALDRDRMFFQAELTQIGSENDRLRGENDRLRSQINALFHSRSWRITAPMRRITSLFRQSG
jgi:hypothetical protein